MSKEPELMDGGDAIDVESRVISVETEGQSGAAAAVTPASQVSATTIVAPFVPQNEIAKLHPAMACLQELKAKVAAALPTLDVSSKEGLARAKELRQECVKLRTGTEDAYEAWNKPVLEAQRGAREVVKQVKAGIESSEKALDAKIKARELEIEAERQRKIKEEEERIAALREKIAALPAILPAAVSMTSAQVENELLRLQDLVITDDVTSFGEFSDEAEALRASTVGKLLEMYTAKKAAEDERVRLDAERRAAQERERAAEIERGLRARITALQQLAFTAMGKPAAQVKSILDELTLKEPLALEFGDLFKEASDTWVMAKVMLENAYAGQKRIEDQQAEQERIAREQAAEAKRLADLEAKERRRQEDEAARERMEQERLQREQVEAEKPTVAECQTYSDHMEPTGEEHNTASEKAAAMEAARGEVDEVFVIATGPGEIIVAPPAEDPLPAGGPFYDPDEPTMSQFASTSDYEEARALYVVQAAWDFKTAGDVVASLVEALELSDFTPTPGDEMCLVSLLLNHEIQAALRSRQAALIVAKTTNTQAAA